MLHGSFQYFLVKVSKHTQAFQSTNEYKIHVPIYHLKSPEVSADCACCITFLIDGGYEQLHLGNRLKFGMAGQVVKLVGGID